MRSFRPDAALTLPREYLADPSRQTAARLYADEFAFRFRLASLLERQLRRLEEIAEERLTEASTDAALAQAILKTVDMLDRIQARLSSLTSDDPAKQVGDTLAKLNALGSELARLRRKTPKTPGAVPADFEVVGEASPSAAPSPDAPATAGEASSGETGRVS